MLTAFTERIRVGKEPGRGVVSGFATALVGPADGTAWRGINVRVGPAVHSSARAWRARRSARALALWSAQRLVLGVVNTCLTGDNSKNFYWSSKTPNTKVWAGIPGYNFCKGQHMFSGVVWLGTRVEVGPMQNSEKPCILPLTKILGIFHSEFGMPPIRWKVFLEILDNFLIGRFWSTYENFWEHARLLQGGLGF
jgi:hypothetical protein